MNATIETVLIDESNFNLPPVTVSADTRPVTEKYSKDEIADICAWMSATLQSESDSKWYSKLVPFRHQYWRDYFKIVEILDASN